MKRKNKRRRKGPAVTLPFSDRLRMAKEQQIGDEREDAATVIVKLACITLNEMDHYGLKRLTEFGVALIANVREYYSDPERMEHWVRKQLEAIGFAVDEDGSVLACQDQDGNVISRKEFEKCVRRNG